MDTWLCFVLTSSVYFPYGNCPKMLYTNVSDKMEYANSSDRDQTAPDQGLHCL